MLFRSTTVTPVTTTTAVPTGGLTKADTGRGVRRTRRRKTDTQSELTAWLEGQQETEAKKRKPAATAPKPTEQEIEVIEEPQPPEPPGYALRSQSTEELRKTIKVMGERMKYLREGRLRREEEEERKRKEKETIEIEDEPEPPEKEEKQSRKRKRELPPIGLPGSPKGRGRGKGGKHKKPGIGSSLFI